MKNLMLIALLLLVGDINAKDPMVKTGIEVLISNNFNSFISILPCLPCQDFHFLSSVLSGAVTIIRIRFLNFP